MGKLAEESGIASSHRRAVVLFVCFYMIAVPENFVYNRKKGGIHFGTGRRHQEAAARTRAAHHPSLEAFG